MSSTDPLTHYSDLPERHRNYTTTATANKEACNIEEYAVSNCSICKKPSVHYVSTGDSKFVTHHISCLIEAVKMANVAMRAENVQLKNQIAQLKEKVEEVTESYADKLRVASDAYNTKLQGNTKEAEDKAEAAAELADSKLNEVKDHL